MSILKPTIINAFNLSEVWYRALAELYHAYSGGGNREYLVEKGSFENQHQRREFDYFMAYITNPGADPIVPIIPEQLAITPPSSIETIQTYFAEYIMGTEVAENETYTYGSRIALSLEKVIDLLRKTPNTNQAIIEIARPEDIELPDPPCLRLIDCRVKDGFLHFIVYFRSWDLWAGLPTNLGGIDLLKQYMAGELGIESGSMLIQSKGAHVYDYVWGDVKALVQYKGM